MRPQATRTRACRTGMQSSRWRYLLASKAAPGSEAGQQEEEFSDTSDDVPDSLLQPRSAASDASSDAEEDVPRAADAADVSGRAVPGEGASGQAAGSTPNWCALDQLVGAPAQAGARSACSGRPRAAG